MPLKNEFFGVYKTLKIGDSFIIATRASRDRSMEVEPKNFIQGTALNKIMDIGKVSETITIDAPILIGGGSVIDGRTLMNNQIDNAMLRTGATLPIIESARINVSERESSVSLTLISDGDPANSNVFQVTDHSSEDLTNGVDSDVLNPLINTPTRSATFYDFRMSLAGYTYFLISANISINVKVTKQVFIAGKDGTTSDGNPIPDPNPYNFGTQYPWLGVSGITITGGGKAAVLLVDNNGDKLYQDAGEAINVNLGDGTELTIQQPGCTSTVDADFAIEVYNCDTETWVGLFRKNGETEDLFDLSESLVTKANFQVTPDLLTVDFEFKCYVQEN
jgi:hypothetical protein